MSGIPYLITTGAVISINHELTSLGGECRVDISVSISIMGVTLLTFNLKPKFITIPSPEDNHYSDYSRWVSRGYNSNRFLSRLGYKDDPNVDLLYGCAGLIGETAEIQSVVMKYIRLSYPIDVVDIIDEMGDQMWFFVLIANTLNVPIRDIMTCNRIKLEHRYPDGNLSRDNRDKKGEKEAIRQFLISKNVIKS